MSYWTDLEDLARLVDKAIRKHPGSIVDPAVIALAQSLAPKLRALHEDPPPVPADLPVEIDDAYPGHDGNALPAPIIADVVLDDQASGEPVDEPAPKPKKKRG